MNPRVRDFLLTTLAVAPLTLLAVLLWRDRVGPFTGAASDAPWVEAIVARVDSLELQNAALQGTLKTAEERIVTMERVFETAGIQLETTIEEIAGLEESFATTRDSVSSMERNLRTTQQQIEDKEAEEEETDEPTLDDFIHIDLGAINGMPGPHIVFEGVNVHVLSGSGATDDFGSVLGLGNLVVGYNEEDRDEPKPRNGSHNLIVGSGHGFPSYGGFLAGYGNLASAPNASVAGGSGNVAAETGAVVCGGDSNTASGINSSVNGGVDNHAEGLFASVTGGQANHAEGPYTSVIGGQGNHAQGDISSISGGAGNETGYRLTAIFGGLDQMVERVGYCMLGIQDVRQDTP